MDIKLITKTNDFLKTAYIAARTCYSDLSPNEMLETEVSQKEIERLLNHIITNKHYSVLEHCQLIFAIKGVSRTLLAQLTRHRIGFSYSVQSQRYVNEKSTKQENNIFDYVVPKSINQNEMALHRYNKIMTDIQDAYDDLINLGISQQDARFVLPGGICTNIFLSCNLRSFIDIYDKRVNKKGAQWEIKDMLEKMKDLLITEEPFLEKYFVKGEK